MQAPKSRASSADLPMPDMLKDRLLIFLATRRWAKEAELLFCNKFGQADGEKQGRAKLAGFRDALIQQFRTARSAIPEPPKIRPLAFCTLRIDFICALCCLSAFTHYGFILMSQKNPETESVRDQQ